MPAHGGCGIMRFDTSLSWPTPKWKKRRSWMSSPQWRFADFRLDPDNACLWRGTQPIALTPKAFDVLHYLVTHPDRLVTKDTLLDAVWPETGDQRCGGAHRHWRVAPGPGRHGAGAPVHCHGAPAGLSLCGARRGAHRGGAGPASPVRRRGDADRPTARGGAAPLPWRHRRPNAATSPCCSATWSTRPRWRDTWTRKTTARWCAPTTRPVPR